MADDLERFVKVHRNDFPQALAEITNGRKQSHWMWYIFPQLAGLGFSETSKFYAIKNRQEANAFINHPILGKNLIKISEALLALESNNPSHIFGTPDDVKLKSSMTLFASLPDASAVFGKVLNKYFRGEKDQHTLNLLADLN